MIEKSCPMCGKYNPADAEVCSHCQARLRPLGSLPESGEQNDIGEQQDIFALKNGLGIEENDDFEDEMIPLSSESVNADEDDVPDWLKELRTMSESELSPDSESEVQPEKETFTTPSKTPYEETILSDQDDDLFKGVLEENDENDVPSWLKDLSDEVVVEPTIEPPENEPEETLPFLDNVLEDQPDWMKALNEISEPEDENLPPFEEEDADILFKELTGSDEESDLTILENEEEPDWEPAVRDTQQIESEEPEPVSDDLPEWLKNEPVEKAEFSEMDSLEEISAPWISDALEEEKEAKTGKDEYEIPTWLKSSIDQQSEEPEKLEEKPFIIDEEVPEWLKNEVDRGEVSEKINELGLASEEIHFPKELFGEDEEEFVEENDDSEEKTDSKTDLKNTVISTVEIAGYEDLKIAPFSEQEIEEMLDGGIEQEPGEEEIAEGEGLEPADLPDWIKSIRPVETMVPEEDRPEEKRVESKGPLAGLQAILPGEDVSLHYQKPPVYTEELKISEKQLAQAALLTNMVNKEREEKHESERKTSTGSKILQLVLSLVLIIAVCIPLFGNIQLDPPMIQMPSAVFAFQTEMNSLQNGDLLLTAVDYSPAFHGELFQMTELALHERLDAGTNVLAVSSMPAGPAISERFLTDYLESSEIEKEDVLYFNLGYLPGGTASIQEFAQHPASAAPVAFGQPVNTDVWQSPSLQFVQTIADFNAVLLVSEDVNLIKTWIEQVQPMMDGKPLLVVTSAQTGPLLQPYVQSGQISGMLSGFADGVIYTNWQTSDAQSGWLSYRFAIYVLIFIIVSGLVVQLIRPLLDGILNEGKTE